MEVANNFLKISSIQKLLKYQAHMMKVSQSRSPRRKSIILLPRSQRYDSVQSGELTSDMLGLPTCETLSTRIEITEYPTCLIEEDEAASVASHEAPELLSDTTDDMVISRKGRTSTQKSRTSQHQKLKKTRSKSIDTLLSDLQKSAKQHHKNNNSTRTPLKNRKQRQHNLNYFQTLPPTPPKSSHPNKFINSQDFKIIKNFATSLQHNIKIAHHKNAHQSQDLLHENETQELGNFEPHSKTNQIENSNNITTLTCSLDNSSIKINNLIKEQNKNLHLETNESDFNFYYSAPDTLRVVDSPYVTKNTTRIKFENQNSVLATEDYNINLETRLINELKQVSISNQIIKHPENLNYLSNTTNIDESNINKNFKNTSTNVDLRRQSL